MTTPTLEHNAQAIAQLTEAVNVLVSQFIRPNAQQANANRESINEVVALLNRHAHAITEIDQRLEATTQRTAANAEQIAANSQQIAALGERIEQFDQRLEETRALVAQNASDIAQASARHDQEMTELRAMQDANAQQIAELGTMQDANAQQIAELGTMQDANAQQIADNTTNIAVLIEENGAFRESQRCLWCCRLSAER
ncbi:MAG: hypothetical protein AAFV46_03750 [Cyanobacteria bacterium J06635_11]